MTPFSYDGLPPPEYFCTVCQVSGVRLYRDYNTFARETKLLCTSCTERAGSEPRKVDPDHPDQCGWMVAAVPTENGETFWGFTSVPWRGVYWWRSLPVVMGQPHPVEYLLSWLKTQVACTASLVESQSKWLSEARASEVALREQINQKDATINALADALCAAKLAMHRGEFGQKGRDRDVPAQIDAALRVAGRRP